MNGELVRRDTTLDQLLEAGRQALVLGDSDAAHEYWRMAAVTSPYEERVWMALMDVLTEADDREVCLENIIAINPLNPEARRQLRAVRHAQREIAESAALAAAAAADPERVAAAAPVVPVRRTRENPPAVPRSRTPLLSAVLLGIGIGLFAVLLGVGASIVVYGGLLTAAP